MKLFLISQDKNTGYDTYDSAVVAAPDIDTARCMHPRGKDHLDYKWSDWTTPNFVKVEYLGETDWPEGVVCASFNAG